MPTAVRSTDLPPARPPPPDMDVDEDDDFELDKAMAGVEEARLQALDTSDPMVLLSYYRHLLPWKNIFLWLNRDVEGANMASTSSPGASRNFTHREFAFTLANEAYLRYNSYATWQELKRDVLRLNPQRFEIGPVYSAKPKDRKTVQKTSFKPVSREVVFDIDMTDYDEIRTCCSGKGICKRCWGFIAVAVEVLDQALRLDFGFKHLLWVYSGRRGIHCWISDEEACTLPDDARKAIVGWLEVIKGGASAVKKVNLAGSSTSARQLHPSLRRALDGSVDAVDGASDGPLKRAFVDIVLKDQDVFRDATGYNRLLALLPSVETEAIARLKSNWDAQPARSSLDKWQDIMTIAAKAGEMRARTTWRPAMEDIILQYTYPRIDAEVSKHMNHLLKAPFVVHPATGRVCVPLDPRQIHQFDPDSDAPTIGELFRDLNAAQKAGEVDDGAALKDNPTAWEHTRLKPFVQRFERHCSAIVRQTREAKRGQALDTMDF
ncbi:prim-pol domain-containing protein [Ceraceosorus guamensis]|uniref:DNA primase n=1 Tax=Ceraceosorus guamensis TaxID=1522189 RepID=A0A316VRL5_9BASI|nr:prim-pol domain-containing protein [Ceraceosorus guamensis]PWN40000.1 prim-pol domain-containing protein [Ceraceosorus guamensis]